MPSNERAERNAYAASLCIYPGLNDARCGDQNSYRLGCRDRNCKSGWKAYCQQHRQDKKLRNRKVSNVWQWPHGTIECYRDGCDCKTCIKASTIDATIRLAEDWCFGDEPNRLSSFQLRDGHGYGRAGYVAKCRCPECRIANRLYSAERRRSRKVRDITLDALALRERRRQIVDAYLDWLGEPSYDDLNALPLERAERNAREAEARHHGYETLPEVTRRPPQPVIDDPEKLIRETTDANNAWAIHHAEKTS